MEIDTYAKIQGDSIEVELMYPRSEDRPKRIIVGLCDVRAADSMEIEYDFERDGYSIKMDETKDADGYMEVLKEKVEVAFIPAWNQSNHQN